MEAIVFRFGFEFEMPERILSWIALVFGAGTSLLWIRAYFRSRRFGWLAMTAGCWLPAAGLWIAQSYIWWAVGAFLLFAGSLSVVAAMRADATREARLRTSEDGKKPPPASDSHS